MEFELNIEQKLLSKSIREFGEKEIYPIIREIEEKGEIPYELIKKLADIGILCMSVEKKYGGAEADMVTVGVAAEELGRSDISCALPTFFLVPTAWGYILNKYGSEKLKEEVLPKVVKGTAFLGIAATEPDTGSNLANIKTIGYKSGDRYIINGEKTFITGIKEIHNLPNGGGYITLVKTKPEAGVRGISLFYIPITNGKEKTKGVTTTLLKEWGRQGISTGGFSLENVDLPDYYLIGDENRGFYIAMEGFDYARAIISLVCCAVAMRCLEEAMKYIKQRSAFGQPLAKFEGIQFNLSENYAKIEAVRLLGYRALWMLEKEQKESLYNRFEVSKVCAEAKLLAPLFSFTAINDALQYFGAYGYTIDCPLDMALRGIRSYFWAEGALEIMKLIISRELLGREFISYT